MKYHRKDKNHDEVVGELREDGLSVTSTSGAGGGFPDVVIGAPGLTLVVDDEAASARLHELLRAADLPGLVIHDGANLIVELKSGRAGDRKTKSPTRERQEKWAREWRGQKAKCLSVPEVFALVGRTRKKDISECPSPLPPCPNAPTPFHLQGRAARP